MASYKKEVNNLVKKYFGIFIRNTKHGYLYEFNGVRIIISSTPRSKGWINDFEKHIKSETRKHRFKHNKTNWKKLVLFFVYFFNYEK